MAHRRCPLWVISGHHALIGMSALPPKADIRRGRPGCPLSAKSRCAVSIDFDIQFLHQFLELGEIIAHEFGEGFGAAADWLLSPIFQVLADRRLGHGFADFYIETCDDGRRRTSRHQHAKPLFGDETWNARLHKCWHVR